MNNYYRSIEYFFIQLKVVSVACWTHMRRVLHSGFAAPFWGHHMPPASAVQTVISATFRLLNLRELINLFFTFF